MTVSSSVDPDWKLNDEVNLRTGLSNDIEKSSLNEKEFLGLGKYDGEDMFAETEDGPDYRGVTTFGAAVLIAKGQLGLGVLGIPSTFDVLGFVPGLISLVGLSILVTWTGVVIGQFRLAHPKVYCIDDATEIMFGKAARELVGWGYWLFYTMCYGAALITVSIALNTFSDHGLCTMAFIGIATGATTILTLFTRTMKVLSWLGFIAISCIFFAIWVVAIACLTQSTPAAAESLVDPAKKVIQVVATHSSYKKIAAAVSVQLLSLAGGASFFTIHAEMKDQTKYTKSLLMGQGFIVFNYIAIACIMYAKVGQYIASPALGSAGRTFQIISYGIAFPGLMFSCFFLAHLAAKYALVRILRGTEHLQKNSKTHWITWTAMVAIVIAVGFVIAGAIPFFGDLLGLIGALLGSIFALIAPGFMCLYDMNYKFEGKVPRGYTWIYKNNGSWTKNFWTKLETLLSFFCIASGIYILFTGVYGSIASIADLYSSGAVSGAFSCADNS